MDGPHTVATADDAPDLAAASLRSATLLWRSLAYCSATSKALRAMPTLCAAMPMRPPSSADSAIR